MYINTLTSTKSWISSDVLKPTKFYNIFSLIWEVVHLVGINIYLRGSPRVDKIEFKVTLQPHIEQFPILLSSQMSLDSLVLNSSRPNNTSSCFTLIVSNKSGGDELHWRVRLASWLAVPILWRVRQENYLFWERREKIDILFIGNSTQVFLRVEILR